MGPQTFLASMSQPNFVAAQYFSGKTAKALSVNILVIEEGISILDAGSNVEIDRFDWEQIEVDEGSERLVHLSKQKTMLSGGAPLLVVEKRDAEQLERSHPPWAARLGKSQKKKVPLWLWSAGIALSVFALRWLVGPVFEHLAVVIPVSWETQIFGDYRPVVESVSCKDQTLNSLVNGFGDRLWKTQSGPGLPPKPEIKIVRGGVMNAFAAPGGLIILNGTLISWTDSPEELVGILAHEMQHVKHRHILAGQMKVAVFQKVLNLALGEPVALGGLSGFSFSRENEAEADRDGIEMLVRAGVSQKGLVEFFKKAQKVDLGLIPEFLATHPHHDSRIKTIEGSLPLLVSDPPVLPAEFKDTGWKAIRENCI